MSRRRAPLKRKRLPDAKFGSEVISQMINYVMSDGKKSAAEKIVYGALEQVELKSKKNALEAFQEAVDNVKPALEVTSRRVGGATYQVPIEVRGDRSLALALRWLRDSARKRGEKEMKDRLAAELMDAVNGRGNAVKKREDAHKMAEANKAFAHYRW